MRSIKFLEDNGVDINKSLELFGDINTYNDTIGEFIVGVNKKIKQLIAFKDNSDMANYAIYVHSIKSDARYFGFMKLGDIAYEHELKSKAGDLYYVKENINTLIEEVNHAVKVLTDYMNGTEDVNSEIRKETINNTELEFNTKTILVVDDSNIVRNFVKRVFSENYNVAIAKDGEEALNLIKANSNNDFIEAILLDLNMPKVDGFAVLDYMKQNSLLQKMPTSIISGDSSKETIDKAFTYEIVDMLEKPFNEQSVKNIVEKTMYSKQFNNE